MSIESKAERWLKLTVAYDGSGYAGWQFQPNLPTVQAALEAAWQQITGERVSVTASGRTDAGVHAAGQVVGLCTASELPLEKLQLGMNSCLPDDVLVTGVTEAPAGFHATHDAIRKTYRYSIVAGRTRPLMNRKTAWHVRQPLDIVQMQQGAMLLCGRHDFACFESTGSPRDSTIRYVTRCDVNSPSSGEVEIEVEGDGFLYNMVRAIAGTLVEIGRGAEQPQWIRTVLASRNRSTAGPTAPAHGLSLLRVDYDLPG